MHLEAVHPFRELHPQEISAVGHGDAVVLPEVPAQRFERGLLLRPECVAQPREMRVVSFMAVPLQK